MHRHQHLSACTYFPRGWIAVKPRYHGLLLRSLESFRMTGQFKEISTGIPAVSRFSVVNQRPPLEMLTVIPRPFSAIRWPLANL